ncbi:hypothetical protein MTO96_047874 [Rhipicephalus appendiculatus]
MPVAQQLLDTFPNLSTGLTALVGFRNAGPLAEVGRRFPMDRLLLETDAAYFLPKSEMPVAQQLLDTFPNLSMGLTALVGFRNAGPLAEVGRRFPMDRLLLETDAAYFLPKSEMPVAQQLLDTFPNLSMGLTALVAFRNVGPLAEVGGRFPMNRLLLETDAAYFLPKSEMPVDCFIHWHCFTGGWTEAKQWLDTFSNLSMGLTPLVGPATRVPSLSAEDGEGVGDRYRLDLS